MANKQATDTQGVPTRAPEDDGKGKPTQKDLAASGYRLPDSFFPGTKSGKGAAENKALNPESFEDKSKDELVELAAKRGLTVTRADGADGEPLKSDYIAALSK